MSLKAFHEKLFGSCNILFFNKLNVRKSKGKKGSIWKGLQERLMFSALYLPLHLTPSASEYPGLQVHVNDPILLMQVALASSQLCSSVSHSSISAIKYSVALNELN